LLGLFVCPRKQGAVQQVPDPFQLEYSYEPRLDGAERLRAALDLIADLILADVSAQPSHPEAEQNAERVP
jgi:hypothetical protein